jgi:hypothetical protein
MATDLVLDDLEVVAPCELVSREGVGAQVTQTMRSSLTLSIGLFPSEGKA